jgi:GR25 family glycosyltransferase involved in LPS biosynthesis
VLPVFVISLPTRNDRREIISKALFEKGIKFDFINAVNLTDFNNSFKTKKQNSLYAIWASHIEALRTAIENESEWALILEDDADIAASDAFSIQYLEKILAQVQGSSVLMLQIGFNFEFGYNKRSRLAKMFFNYFRFLPSNRKAILQSIRNLGLINYFKLSAAVSGKIRLFQFLVSGHTERGCHAYLVNRSFSKMLVNFGENNLNSENLPPIDTFLHQSKMGKLNFSSQVMRPNVPMLHQTNSPSDNLF